MDVLRPRRHPGTSSVFPQLAQFPGEAGYRRRQRGHRTPQLTQGHMVIGPHPGPQLDRFGGLSVEDAEELLQVQTNPAARPPQVGGRWRLRGQYARAYPAAGSLGIEFGGHGVVLATVLGDYPDRDQLDGAAVLNEFGVVEVPHPESLGAA